MIVVLFTNSFPYDFAAEQNFFMGEVKVLSERFDRVILVPRTVRGNLLSVPAGVEVDVSFAKRFTLGRRLALSALALFSKEFYLDIRNHLPASLAPGYLRRLFSFLAGAILTRDWGKNWLRQQQEETPTDVIFYTYWFNEITMGLGLIKSDHPALRVVTRAHGYDIYEELYGTWPCRFTALSLLDGLYSVSEAGTTYLREKYPEFKDRYETLLLGVPDPQSVAKSSSDGVLRIVSCSSINSIKRIDLLFRSVQVAARLRETQAFEWRHFGGGDRLKEFIEKAHKESRPNAAIKFHGHVSRHELIQNYLAQPVDIFINVSSTEGTPVSIMEAISCGIPVIATAVGGNVEIVQEKNGFLLSENPTPDGIADALLQVLDNREIWLEKRKGSREVWQERYNETTNFEAFAQALVEIRKR